MTIEDSSGDTTFTLTPPEPVAAVPREKAGGLVPVEESVRTDMARKAEEYVRGLAALDARSPEFAGRVGEITSLGAGEMRTAAAQSNRMLERTVRSLPSKGGDAQSQVGGSLVELRRVVEDLDPRDLAASRGRKFLSRLPGGNKLRDHVAKYASAQGTLNRIVGSLRGGQDELRRDNAALQTERVRLWETMGKLQEYVVLTEALDTAVEAHIRTHTDGADPQQGDTLRADVLFPVRQKHQDLLTQLAVCAQGYLAMDVVRRNNEELIKGVDRAATTTVSALRISVMLASALDNQKKVVDQVNALRGTTEDLIRGNAEMLATQTGEIQRIAADPAVGAETLRSAFQQIYRTLDAIDTYKVQATETMAATVESLTSELQNATQYLERSRNRGALEGGLG
ncbi:toxic anion resistance protein [Streptomyces europaeiscabiei]|uniref:toxic anion resistance protein n=1 Tax=Streptomyces europaeiscabiei TaxID=146819 RepID=UPI0007659CA4|nr:toxic anion resistance protein [Streptomyces europaeiscabiei]MDX2773185.1 toxic anion resistance protein [Streptomyces europaeiscabiei]MDX3667734.1 toxic anion resistance protein [Streptomyces europaeiscabiei]MDX3777129.1 toxic anion resistance protein [Streptomyces europaeiscabiei]MDX3842993.1 toxic anion resistance protein [Streptomyces europaeiscabiei]